MCVSIEYKVVIERMNSSRNDEVIIDIDRGSLDRLKHKEFLVIRTSDFGLDCCDTILSDDTRGNDIAYYSHTALNKKQKLRLFINLH